MTTRTYSRRPAFLRSANPSWRTGDRRLVTRAAEASSTVGPDPRKRDLGRHRFSGVLLVLTAHDVEKEIVRAIPSFRDDAAVRHRGCSGGGPLGVGRRDRSLRGTPASPSAFVVPRLSRSRAMPPTDRVEYEVLEPVVDIERALALARPMFGTTCRATCRSIGRAGMPRRGVGDSLDRRTSHASLSSTIV